MPVVRWRPHVWRAACHLRESRSSARRAAGQSGAAIANLPENCMAGIAARFLLMRSSCRFSSACITSRATPMTRPVALGPQVIRLRPAPHARTRIPSYSLKITPAAHHVNWQNDPHGNWVARCTFPERTTRVLGHGRPACRARAVQSVRLLHRALRGHLPVHAAGRVSRRSSAAISIWSRSGRRLRAFMAEVPRGPVGTVAFLTDLNNRVQRAVRYTVRMETGTRTPEETLEAGAAPAATARGCWCRRCAASACRRASCRAI